MFREFKEGAEETKKTMREQNGNVNKKIENLKGNKQNSGVAKKYNNQGETCTRGIQSQT